MITEIEDYFTRGCGRCARFETDACATRLWAGGLAELRRLCRGAGLVETVKWGHPCYMHSGRNIALIGALRADFRLSFFQGGLMTDPDGVLERQGPNSRHADTLRFGDVAEVHSRAATIRAYLAEAIGYASAGLKAPVAERALELPEALLRALDADADLARAFHALTTGRQRSYVVALASAKTEATRRARIERFRDRILAGKGATER
jgi:uncharacterized protein YdeI (YjbR/CyaY-like superfamily)